MCTSSLIPLLSLEEAQLPTSLALGSFDGLHAGHKSVIKEITKKNIRDKNGIPTVVSFWPHPREVLYKETRLRLDLPSEKIDLLQPLGIKQLVLIPFDKNLSALSPDKFVKTILLEQLKACRIAVGENFRFGKDRSGDALCLKKLAEASNVEVCIVPILKDQSGRMSSSRIRDALSIGDLINAEKLMGRPYKFQGKVVKGKGIGTKIGWPTANLEVDGRKFLPGIGVYAAYAWIETNCTPFPAVMNLGPQPTINPKSPSAVEVHIINKEINLKECQLTIQPIKRLRGQKRFKNLQELSKQIALDKEKALSELRNT